MSIPPVTTTEDPGAGQPGAAPVLDAQRRGGATFSVAGRVETRTARQQMDAALRELTAAKDGWASLALGDRITILDRLMRDLPGIAERWVRASAEAKGIPPGSTREGEEWAAAVMILRTVGRLRQSLQEIRDHGRPRLPGPLRRLPGGQLAVPVFPTTWWERLLFSGYSSEIWLEPGVTAEQLEREHAAIYRGPAPAGKLALVLAAGNYSNLGPGDMLHKLFSELQVVAYKTNPVNAYLGPLIEEGFRVLVERGLLRVIYGGAEEGAYLSGHELVDEIHLTGSDKTYEAVVFGPGEEGAARKARREPLITKRVTCELGNLSPAIVVPGPWSASDRAYQAEHIASTLTLNAGFNCLSTRVLVQHAQWDQRQALLQDVRAVFERTPTRRAYYPGARQIHRAFLEAHPEAWQIGDPPQGHLPWTLIPGVDPGQADDICFSTEGFCSLFAETAIEAASVPEYIDAAVKLVNEQVWGTLTCTLFVHPASLEDPAVAAALERAVADLRYGTVGVNVWGAISFTFTTTSWGAFPGHPSHDIQSGSGAVNNTTLLPRVQKTVTRGPFRQRPKPPWFPSHATTVPLYRRLLRLEIAPSPWKIPGLLWTALWG
jgi:hypothetical protein